MGKRNSKSDNGKAEAALGFDEKLWLSADKLSGSIDAAEYMHLVLGLLFLEYISDAFQGLRDEIEAISRDEASDWFCPDDEARELLLENRDEYASQNFFCVPRAHTAATFWPTPRSLMRQAHQRCDDSST